MKTTLLSLKAFFTICLLCLVGGVNVMAQETYEVPFANSFKTKAKSAKINNHTWTLSKACTYGATSNGVLQLGSGNKPMKDFSLTATDYKGIITKIIVNAYAKNATSTLSISVGSVNFKGENAIPTELGDMVFTGKAQGDIVLSINASKQFYLKSITIEYTYVMPNAPITYTIWSEDWSSFSTDEKPSNGTNATYHYGSGTKLYFTKLDNYAGGEVPELLIKPQQSLTIDVTSLKGYSGTLYFSFLTNKNKSKVESTTTGVKIGEPTIKGDKKYIYTYTITVPEGTEGLNLKLTNTDTEKDNMRVDNLELYAVKTGSFTITPARYGTYYTEDAFVMPEGVTGYTITDKNEESLTLNAAYPANEVVPAKTALLLKATETPATNQEFTYTIVNSDEVAPAGNLLHGSVEATETHVEGATAYYKLAEGDEGLGFYWANANGTAFTNGANKAYLAIKGNLSQMRGFSFESMTTGINNVVANANNSKNAVIYDLNGRRVNSLNTAKGVYIVNGKKVIVK